MSFLPSLKHSHFVLLYLTYCWLMLSGLLQISIDVISQHLSGKRIPGSATTLYYGLNTAYGLSQILFAALTLFVSYRIGPRLMSEGMGLCLGLVAGFTWLAFSLAFIEYPQPRMTVAMFLVLLLATAFTA